MFTPYFITKHETILKQVFLYSGSVSVTYILAFITRTFYVTCCLTMHIHPRINHFFFRKCEVQKQFDIVTIFRIKKSITIGLFIHPPSISIPRYY
ncbi:hypothetical protein HanXRQr2_Chr07g0300471 [Helianthus annuus]|uniref:Uncharacterized protein n=1 Tax=Helianthus annuus TaxID=4232 RepID=A0A9K3ILN5_HELAN|nr:hypothetical protein HanXRQr2_Chr07g0300471 [Helianthus annuus]